MNNRFDFTRFAMDARSPDPEAFGKEMARRGISDFSDLAQQAFEGAGIEDVPDDWMKKARAAYLVAKSG